MDSLSALWASLLLAVLTLANMLEDLDLTLMNMNLGPLMSSSTPGGSAMKPSTTSGWNESSLTSFKGTLPNSSQWQPTTDLSCPLRRWSIRPTAIGQLLEHSVPIEQNSSTTYLTTSTSLARPH